MSAKTIQLLLVTVAISLTGTAHTQIPPMPRGSPAPNAAIEDAEAMQKIQLLEDQRRRDAQAQRSQQAGHGAPAGDPAVVQAQVAKFMEAIKPRRHRFADFDQVVIHSRTPVTPEMLGLMAESPYAADIAYYLGKHPEQSGAIAQMPPAEARLAVQQIEASVSVENITRK